MTISDSSFCFINIDWSHGFCKTNQLIKAMTYICNFNLFETVFGLPASRLHSLTPLPAVPYCF